MLFWIARVVAITGSTITAVVLPILVFQITGSAPAEALDVRSALLIVSIGVGLSALIGWFSPRREPAREAA